MTGGAALPTHRIGEAEGPRSPLLPAPPTKPSSLKRLQELAARIPTEADLILLGDSLAAGWSDEVLRARLPEHRLFNLGLPGDRVQNTLWRLSAAGLSHLRPRSLVILLGTNNLGDRDPPAQIAAGLGAVVAKAAELWGGPRTILVTLPWRRSDGAIREPNRRAVNALIQAETAPGGGHAVIDADSVLDCAPPLYRSLEPDLLHVSQHGYRRLTAALAGLVQETDG